MKTIKELVNFCFGKFKELEQMGLIDSDDPALLKITADVKEYNEKKERNREL